MENLEILTYDKIIDFARSSWNIWTSSKTMHFFGEG